MKTINQINGRLKTNSTIQFYNEVRECDRNSKHDWRNKYYDITRNGHTDRSPSVSNAMYYRCEKEYCLLTGRPLKYEYSIKEAEVVIDSIQMKVHLHGCPFKGITIRINGAWIDCLNGDYVVKSSETLESIDLESYVKTHIFYAKVFAPGVFADLQYHYNCDKETAKQKYIAGLNWWKPKEQQYPTIAQDKSAHRWLKRHKNLLLPDHITLDSNFMLRAFTLANYKKPINVYGIDTAFADNLDGDIDELENEFYEANPTGNVYI